MDREKPSKITISYYITPSLVEALKHRATANRRSPSVELEMILEKALAKELAA